MIVTFWFTSGKEVTLPISDKIADQLRSYMASTMPATIAFITGDQEAFYAAQSAIAAIHVKNDSDASQ